MRILHIAPNITVKFGGPVTTMNNIIRIWLSAGHSTQILALDVDGKVASINGDLKIVRPSFPARFGNSKAAAHWLAKSFSRFDLVFIHGIWTAINLRSCLFLCYQKHPYVIIPHGSLDPFDLQKKLFLKRIIGSLFVCKCLAGSAAVLCSTQREADCLVTYGAKCLKIVLPWPTSPVFSHIGRQEARRALAISDDEFVVLSLGRIDYKKGFPVLLPAMKRLVQINAKTRLLIVGPDSNGYLRLVQQLVERLGLNGAVRFLPPAVGDEKIRLQCAADCFALPSLNENFGNAVVEAMQQGLPCVISNNVYICDSVEQDGAGLVCRYDEQEVFAALRKLSENPELRAKMSGAAVRLAKQFEPETLKERYLAILEKTTKSHN
jgi:glycosyltransferase involved in cell wall biosynthesis